MELQVEEGKGLLVGQRCCRTDRRESVVLGTPLVEGSFGRDGKVEVVVRPTGSRGRPGKEDVRQEGGG